MFFLGTHRISYESLRRLAVECYALGTSARSLLKADDYEDTDGKTKELFEQILSEKLLQLAIGIRTKLYQGADHRRTSGFLEGTGTYIRYDTYSETDPIPYTLKDICDKIIHADSVDLVLDSNNDIDFIDLSGGQTVGKQTQRWVLTLFLPAVCKGILEWIDVTAEA